MRMVIVALVAGLFPMLGLLGGARADLLWGVNGHPFTAYPGIPYRQQLELVKDLGLRSYRVNISAPSQGSMLARLVADAKPLGIDILPVVTPAVNLKTESADQLYARAYKIAVALVSRFKDDIRVWELGNELENFAIITACEMRDNGEQYNCAWGPAGGVGPLDYYGPRWAKVSAVLKGLSDGTMSVDPSIRKAIGTAGWGHVGAFERMRQDGINWDISVWHTYGEDPEWAFKALAKFDRPIWVTEFNNPRGSQRGEEEQAHGLVKQMTRLRALHKAYNVEAAHVYELLDEPYWAPSFEAFMGLVRLEKTANRRWTVGSRKPAYDSVKQLIARGPASMPASTSGDASAAPASLGASNPRDCDLDRLARRQPQTAEAQVEYAYCLALSRPADGGGLKSWSASRERGLPSVQIVMAMLSSDEFARRHAVPKLDNAAFVTLMFDLLLGREPDGGGLSTYVDQLERGTADRAGVAKSIIASAEFRSRHPILFTLDVSPGVKPQTKSEVTRSCELESHNPAELNAERQAAYVYCLASGGTARADDLEHWSAELARGTPPWQMLASLLDSDAFSQQHATSTLDSRAFVTLLYQVLLDRQPDGAGPSSYAAQLDRGAMSRSGLARALIASSEFGAKHPSLFRKPHDQAVQPARSQ